MRYDPKRMRMLVSLRPDNTFPFEKPYSWAIQCFVESERGWYNVHFSRAETQDQAWQEATAEANKIEETVSPIEQRQVKLKLKPSVT